MHDCPYATAIGKIPYYIENEAGKEVCGYCHVPKTQMPKAPAKTLGK